MVMDFEGRGSRSVSQIDKSLFARGNVSNTMVL